MNSFQKQLTLLLIRAGGKCSYKNCNNRLSIKEEDGKITNVSEIAHIRAEKERGPRYDPKFDIKKINDYENLILLCREHHKLIDDRPDIYSTKKLLEMKSIHEEKIEKISNKIKEIYSTIWKPASEFSSLEILGIERGSIDHSFNEFYYAREVDKKFSELLADTGKGILLVGRPLSGKTRMVFEWFKKSQNTDVLIPKKIDYKLEDVLIPIYYDTETKKIVFLDDLIAYIQLDNFHLLFAEFIKRNDIVIVATSQSSYVFEKIKYFLHDKLRINIETIFNIIHIDDITEKEAQEITSTVKKEWKEVSFDGTIGSIFLPLMEMERRYKEECSSLDVYIMKAIKIGYLSGLVRGNYFSKTDWLIDICKGFFDIELKPQELSDILNHLVKLQFLNKEKDILIVESAYLYKLIDPSMETLPIESFSLLKEIFSQKPIILFYVCMQIIANRKLDPNYTIEFLKLGIDILESILNRVDNDYIKTQVSYLISLSFGELAELVNTVENNRRTIKISKNMLKKMNIDENPIEYSLVLLSLGAAYRNLSIAKDTEKNAEKALKINYDILNLYSKSYPLPFHPANVLSNIGLVYVDLATVKKPKEMYLEAISHFKKGIEIINLEDFPEEYGILHTNLGEAFSHLANVENYTENISNGLEALNETFKVYNEDSHPYDFALSCMNIGSLYRMLAIEENLVENCEKSIEYFSKSLDYFENTNLPLKYGDCILDLGNTYTILYGNQKNEDQFNKALQYFRTALEIFRENESNIYYGIALNNIGNLYFVKTTNSDDMAFLRIAIQHYKRSLEKRTRKIVPIEYAETKTNLGNAYLLLATKINKKKNLKKAISEYNTALEILTFKNSRISYGKIKGQIGRAYLMLSEFTEKSKNCKLAQRAFEEALNASKNHSAKLFSFIKEDMKKLKEICPSKK